MAKNKWWKTSLKIALHFTHEKGFFMVHVGLGAAPGCHSHSLASVTVGVVAGGGPLALLAVHGRGVGTRPTACNTSRKIHSRVTTAVGNESPANYTVLVLLFLLG